MSPDLIAETARIQHSERVDASLRRLQYIPVDDEARMATSRRRSSFTRRVLATAAIALGLSAGVVGTLNVVHTTNTAATVSHSTVVFRHIAAGAELAIAPKPNAHAG